MPKQTDIVGTIRVPEEYYGRFWNFMRSMPAAEFTPIVQAQAPAKRKHGKIADGTTGRCIVLGALKSGAKDVSELNALMVAAGKSPNSLHGLLHGMKNAKELGKGAGGKYAITTKGREYLKKNCKGG